MSYQVGELTNPRPDDPWFGTVDEALKSARHMASKDDNLPIAVWDENAEVQTLFLCGQEFEPA